VTRFDVAVVGAGPAGLAAAARAATGGRRVVLIDGGVLPGGQYWRHRKHLPPVSTGYRKLATALDTVEYRAGASVWFVEPGFVLHTTAGEVAAERLVLATGAHDRVLPFPGWTLPGVSTAGGAQALLKGNGVLVGRRVVVAGTGPFLLPVAAGLATAGARVVGVFEANNPLRLAHRTPARKLAEAARYAATFARHRIPYRTRHTVVAAHGTQDVEAVSVAGPRGTRTITCDALTVGSGFVPAIELGTLLGCATRVDADTNLVLTVDDEQRTSVPGVYAAGEITGVGGADLAIVEGEIAGAVAADATPEPKLANRRARLRRFAAALMRSFPVPPQWPDALRDDTVVCRCEEVPYATVRDAVRELGATDARTVKLLSRTGMGWCQGRMCGYPVACLTATLCDRPVTKMDLEAFAHRPFAAPITLGQLAGEPDLIE
jgi:NADPH-dependent 2,4-dienoyl-CoA reductase/sulfur reductase-like enzyme